MIVLRGHDSLPLRAQPGFQLSAESGDLPRTATWSQPLPARTTRIEVSDSACGGTGVWSRCVREKTRMRPGIVPTRKGCPRRRKVFCQWFLGAAVGGGVMGKRCPHWRYLSASRQLERIRGGSQNRARGANLHGCRKLKSSVGLSFRQSVHRLAWIRSRRSLGEKRRCRGRASRRPRDAGLR